MIPLGLESAGSGQRRFAFSAGALWVPLSRRDLSKLITGPYNLDQGQDTIKIRATDLSPIDGDHLKDLLDL